MRMHALRRRLNRNCVDLARASAPAILEKARQKRQEQNDRRRLMRDPAFFAEQLFGIKVPSYLQLPERPGKLRGMVTGEA